MKYNLQLEVANLNFVLFGGNYGEKNTPSHRQVG